MYKFNIVKLFISSANFLVSMQVSRARLLAHISPPYASARVAHQCTHAVLYYVLSMLMFSSLALPTPNRKHINQHCQDDSQNPAIF